MTDIRYDFFGQELAVGDTVIWGTTMGEGRGFEFGTVKVFTPKKVTVTRANKDRWSNDCSCYANQLCKVDPELITMKLLKGV
jgi:hypothetical protein